MSSVAILRCAARRLCTTTSILHQQQPCTSSASAVKINVTGAADITLETGGMARLADGAVLARQGGTAVLATAVSKTKQLDMAGFMPLVVDYRQRSAARGRIPTTLGRRDRFGQESDILAARLIDRSIRPLFPEGFNYPTQIVCNVLSADQEDPVTLAANAAIAALAVSDIPFEAPAAVVRVVGSEERGLEVLPALNHSSPPNLDLVLTTTAIPDTVLMLELVANEVTQENLEEAVEVGLEEAKRICDGIQALCEKAGKPKREVVQYFLPSPKLLERAVQLGRDRIQDVLQTHTHDKASRDAALTEIRTDLETMITGEVAEEAGGSDDPATVDASPAVTNRDIQHSVNAAVKQVFRSHVLNTSLRCDGRRLDELRQITSQTDVFPALHGSAVFRRGQSQVMATVTFDSPEAAFRDEEGAEKRFMLHYEFPQYAINEIGRLGGAGLNRREVGHGNLAERALKNLVPSEFPFTIRLQAEVLESNGSTSMAAACAGSLALLDAGVELKNSVSGVAIGLIEDTLLTDLMGIEDYMGDMDFKIASTKKGFTAAQLDLKLRGVSKHTVYEALRRAAAANGEILSIMAASRALPREKLKDNGPVLEKLTVPLAKRAKLFGLQSGGLNLKRLKAQTGVSVTQLDDITYSVFAPSASSFSEARALIDSYLSEPDDLTDQLQFGSIVQARVVEIQERGVMVTLFEGTVPIFVPLSQLSPKAISHPSLLGIERNDSVAFKFYGRDPTSGRIRLSRRAINQTEPRAPRSRPNQNDGSSPWANESRPYSNLKPRCQFSMPAPGSIASFRSLHSPSSSARSLANRRSDPHPYAHARACPILRPQPGSLTAHQLEEQIRRATVSATHRRQRQQRQTQVQEQPDSTSNCCDTATSHSTVTNLSDSSSLKRKSPEISHLKDLFELCKRESELKQRRKSVEEVIASLREEIETRRHAKEMLEEELNEVEREREALVAEQHSNRNEDLLFTRRLKTE